MRHVVTYTLILAFVLAIGAGCASKPKKGPSSSFSSKPKNPPPPNEEENKRNFNPIEADIDEGNIVDGNRPDIFGEDQGLDDGQGGLGGLDGGIADPGGVDPGGEVFPFPSPSPGLDGIDIGSFPSASVPRATPSPAPLTPTPTPTPGVGVRRPGNLGIPFRSFNANSDLISRTGRAVHGEQEARRGRAIRGDGWTGTGTVPRRQRYVAE